MPGPAVLLLLGGSATYVALEYVYKVQSDEAGGQSTPWYHRLLRTLTGRLLKQPAVKCDVMMRDSIEIRTSEGARLIMSHFYPQGKAGEKMPCILIRTPYDRAWLRYTAERFASHGYHVLVQDTRGRASDAQPASSSSSSAAASSSSSSAAAPSSSSSSSSSAAAAGPAAADPAVTSESKEEFFPIINEEKDGIATLQWLQQQPWFDGRCGMYGPSYLGIVQFAVVDQAATGAGAAAAASEESEASSDQVGVEAVPVPKQKKQPILQAIVPSISAAQVYPIIYPHGALHLDLCCRWLYLVFNVRDPTKSTWGSARARWNQEAVISQAFQTYPLTEIDKVLVGKELPFFRETLEYSDPSCSYWSERKGHGLCDYENCPPTHLIHGWYDMFLNSGLRDYEALKRIYQRKRAEGDASALPPYLTIGSFVHFGFREYSGLMFSESLAWYERFLKGKTEPGIIRAKPVRVQVMGLSAAQRKKTAAGTAPAPASSSSSFSSSSSSSSSSVPSATSIATTDVSESVDLGSTPVREVVEAVPVPSSAVASSSSSSSSSSTSSVSRVRSFFSSIFRTSASSTTSSTSDQLSQTPETVSSTALTVEGPASISAAAASASVAAAEQKAATILESASTSASTSTSTSDESLPQMIVAAPAAAAESAEFAISPLATPPSASSEISPGGGGDWVDFDEFPPPNCTPLRAILSAHGKIRLEDHPLIPSSATATSTAPAITAASAVAATASASAASASSPVLSPARPSALATLASPLQALKSFISPASSTSSSSSSSSPSSSSPSSPTKSISSAAPGSPSKSYAQGIPAAFYDPLEDGGIDRYIYDPRDPTPAIGGCAFDPSNSGPLDNRPIESRSDLLIYTSEPLEQPMAIIGYVRAELYVSSTAAHTDFVARLLDVSPDGKSTTLCDGLFRLKPETTATSEAKEAKEEDGSAPDSKAAAARTVNGSSSSSGTGTGTGTALRRVEVDMWATANVFEKGHRIRVHICSSLHPRLARHLNADVPLASSTLADAVRAEQRVHRGGQTPSCVILPLIPLSDLGY